MKILPVLLCVLIGSCGMDADLDGIDFKQEMRDFVIGIAEYARESDADFIVIPQNGIEIVTEDGESDSASADAYLEAIDGHGQEDLFYGYDSDDRATNSEDTAYLRAFLDISKAAGNVILVTDYCSTHANMDDSYSVNADAGYVSFAADHRELDNIPDWPATINNVNSGDAAALSDVSNFLYLINPEQYASKQALIDAVQATDYDLLIMDLFFDEDTMFTAAELTELKQKANGGSRLVVSYMSIGEAEDYRYYWQEEWDSEEPDWLEAENTQWRGNYKVRYWDTDWQDIIFGNTDSYCARILNAGFDGVYLDIIEAFEFFE